MDHFWRKYLAKLALGQFVSRCYRHPWRKVHERDESGNSIVFVITSLGSANCGRSSLCALSTPPFYESSCSVKRERTVAAPVTLPFFYPSIGVSLAPVGCFEVALAAPSPNEPKAQGGVELASTSTGLRSLVPFFPFEALENPPIVQDRQRQPIRRRVFSSHDRVGASTG